MLPDRKNVKIKVDEFTSDNVGQEVEDGVFCFAVHFRTIGQDQILQARNGRFGQLIIILLDTPPIQKIQIIGALFP